MQVIERLQQYPGVKQSVDYLSSWIGSYGTDQVPLDTVDGKKSDEVSDQPTTEDKETHAVPDHVTSADRPSDDTAPCDDPMDPDNARQLRPSSDAIVIPQSDRQTGNALPPVPSLEYASCDSTSSSILFNNHAECTSLSGARPRCSRSEWSSASDSDNCGCRSNSDSDTMMVQSKRRKNNNSSRRKRSSLQNKLFVRRTRLWCEDIDGGHSSRGDHMPVHGRRGDVSLPRIDSVEEISLSEQFGDVLAIRENDIDVDTVQIDLVTGVGADNELLSSGSLELSSDWSEYTLSVTSVGMECRESDAASVSCLSQDGQSHLDVPVSRHRSRRKPYQIGHAVNDTFVDRECINCTIL